MNVTRLMEFVIFLNVYKWKFIVIFKIKMFLSSLLRHEKCQSVCFSGNSRWGNRISIFKCTVFVGIRNGGVQRRKNNMK